MDQLQPSEPAQPLPIYDKPLPNTKKPLLIIGLILLSLVIIIGAIYTGIKIAQKKNQTQITSTTKNPISSTKIQSNPTVAPTTDPTANWKAYRSEKGGFELKYPDYWKEPTVEIYKKIPSQSIKQWLMVNDKTFTEKFVYSEKDILIDGRQGIIREMESMVGRTLRVYTTLNDSEILLFYTNPVYSCTKPISPKYYCYQPGVNTSFSGKILEVFDQILSTFKFLTPSSSLKIPDVAAETAGWKTYSNTTIGLSFMYPPSYSSSPETENFISLMSPLSPNHNKFFINQNELKIEVYVEKSKENDSSEKCSYDHISSETKILNKTEITIAGIKGINFKSQESGGDGESVCLIYGGKRYFINKGPLNTSRQNEFYQILSTFKFL